MITINPIFPCKSPVSWVGNKSPILGIILALMPLDCPRFVDVFGGSGTVTLGKPPGNDFEVYNDFDGNLVNLFRCMKKRPLSVIRELGFLTLNSRDDFIVLRRFINQEEFNDEFFEQEMQLTQITLPHLEADEISKLMLGKSKDYEVIRACNYLKLLRYSYSSGGKSFASQPFDIRKLFYLIWQTHARFSNVVIENQDFEKLIKHYDRENTVFYLDPPYYQTEGIHTREVPDSVSIMIAITALIGKELSNIPTMLLAAVLITLPQLAIAIIRPNTYGGADIKLMAACTFLLGFEKGLIAIIVGLLLAVSCTVITRKMKNQSLKDSFALIPYLASGSMLAYFI